MKNKNLINPRQCIQISKIIGKTKVIIENKTLDKKILIVSDRLLNKIYDVVERSVRIKKVLKKNNVMHKSHANERKTVCGVKYDNTIMHEFIPNQLAGHWRRVTCKRCLKCRNENKGVTKDGE